MADKTPIPDDISRIIMLIFGKMEHGGPYWCYVAAKPSRHTEFQRVLSSRQYNPHNFAKDGYGEVIVSGEGALPPPDVSKKVAELFQIPIRDMFKDNDPQATIMKKIEELKNKQG